MPKYDRELIARMLGALASFPERLTGFKVESVSEQARLLREAENLEADARTVVRDERGSDPRVDDDSFSAAIRACRSQLGARRPDDSEPEEQWMWDKLTKLESLLSAASGEKGGGQMNPYGWLDKDDNFLTDAKRTRMIEAGKRHGASIGEVTFGKIAQAHDRPVYLDHPETLSALERLVKESVHPYDGGEYEDGEWEALDIARSAIAKATDHQQNAAQGGKE